MPVQWNATVCSAVSAKFLALILDQPISHFQAGFTDIGSNWETPERYGERWNRGRALNRTTEWLPAVKSENPNDRMIPFWIATWKRWEARAGAHLREIAAPITRSNTTATPALKRGLNATITAGLMRLRRIHDRLIGQGT